MKVGIPVLKCSLNPSQQINKRTGKKAKTCSVGAAWNEMNDNRYGRDPTIEKELTYRNVWMLGHSNDDIEAIVKNEIEKINLERKMAGKRALRSDAVSVLEIVEKPNIEMMEKMNYEEKKEFLSKSHDVMENLIKEWNPDWKWLASVQHHDEFGGVSAHTHSLIMPITFDENGIKTLNAKKEVGIKFFSFINKNYPKLMREAGYTMVEDCVTYDQLTEEEKLERRLHPQENGIDAYQYKQKKFKEMEQKLEEISLENKKMDERLEKKIIEYTNAPTLQKYKTVKSENEKLQQEIFEKNGLIKKLEKELDTAKKKIESLKMRLINMSKLAGRRLMSVLGMPDEDIAVKNELPLPIVQEKINGMINGMDEQMKEIVPKNCRVIPDANNTGTFMVISKTEKNEYMKVKDGFESRSVAENYIKELKCWHIKIDENMHSGIKLGQK